MNNTFQLILENQQSYYPLVEAGLVSGDELNNITEELVYKAGYDMEQFSTYCEGL